MEQRTWITGSEPKLDLAYTDVWLPGVYSRRVLVFELPHCSNSDQAIAVIKRALTALVKGTPELGGSCTIIPKEDYNGKIPWRAIRPSNGVEFVTKNLSVDGFPSLKELQSQSFPVASFKDDLLMPVPSKAGSDPQPIAKFQVSLAEGGLLLSVCIDHRLTDGNGINIIIQKLAGACQQAARSNGDLNPITFNMDRSVLLAVPDASTDIIRHPAYRIVSHAYEPTIPARAETVPAQDTTSVPNDSKVSRANSLSSDFVPKAFCISPESALRLKKDACTPGSGWISTHDAIIALLWRTVVRARYAIGRLKFDDITSCGFPLDSRRLLGLPIDWVGNCVYFCAAEAPMSMFLSGDETEMLRVLAARIRDTINKVDHKCVAEIMSLRRFDPYSLVWWQSANTGDPKVVGVTSFYHSKLLHSDWGATLGSVRHFTATDKGFLADGLQRVFYIGPKTKNGGGCNVMAGVDPEESEFFRVDKLWNHYFER